MKAIFRNAFQQKSDFEDKSTYTLTACDHRIEDRKQKEATKTWAMLPVPFQCQRCTLVAFTQVVRVNHASRTYQLPKKTGDQSNATYCNCGERHPTSCRGCDKCSEVRGKIRHGKTKQRQIFNSEKHRTETGQASVINEGSKTPRKPTGILTENRHIDIYVMERIQTNLVDWIQEALNTFRG